MVLIGARKHTGVHGHGAAGHADKDAVQRWVFYDLHVTPAVVVTRTVRRPYPTIQPF